MSPPFQTVNTSYWSNPAFIFGSSVTQCSNQGQIFNSTCVCSPNWSGRSDFVNAEYVQCHLNTVALLVLWVINVALFILAAVYAAPRLCTLYMRFRAAQVTQGEKGHQMSIWDNKGLVSLLFFFAICFPSHLIVGFFRIFDFNRKIGLDVTITIFWALERLGFYTAVAIHQPALMRHMLQAQDATARIIRRADLAGRGIAALATLSALWTIPILATGGVNINLARACFVMFVFTQTLTFAFLHVQARFIQRNINNILTAAYIQTKDEAILILRKKLSIGQDNIVRNSIPQVVIYFVFLCVPQLWITYDYLLVISWFGPILASRRITDSVYMEEAEHEIVSGHGPASNPNPETIASIDVETVLEVNEDSPELLARGYKWSLQKRQRQKTGPLLKAMASKNGGDGIVTAGTT